MEQKKPHKEYDKAQSSPKEREKERDKDRETETEAILVQ